MMKMRVLSARVLGIVVAIDVVALIVSGLLRNAHHGPGSVIADIAWFTFLIATLVVIVLAVGILVSSARGRRAA